MMDKVIVEREKNTGIITLNRPEKLNALDFDTQRLLYDTLKELDSDEDIRVVVITGKGRGFCSGADVGSLEKEGEKPLAEWVKGFVSRESIITLPSLITGMGKPVIAAVNGVTAGMGVSLALSCDIRFASEEAKFSLAFVRRGLIPDCGATFLLPRIVGIPKALELMLTGDLIDAAEAEKAGLVNRVYPPDKLMEETLKFADKLSKGPPLAQKFIKNACYKSLNLDLGTQTLYEIFIQAILRETEDHKEGVRSFLEKREPEFKGR